MFLLESDFDEFRSFMSLKSIDSSLIIESFCSDSYELLKLKFRNMELNEPLFDLLSKLRCFFNINKFGITRYLPYSEIISVSMLISSNLELDSAEMNLMTTASFFLLILFFENYTICIE